MVCFGKSVASRLFLVVNPTGAEMQTVPNGTRVWIRQADSPGSLKICFGGCDQSRIDFRRVGDHASTVTDGVSQLPFGSR